MREKVSVALASCNGEKYIGRQIESILRNLSSTDELIVSDDGSADETLRVVESFRDQRIKVVKGPGLGVKKNFENAIRNCTGKYIFLSDQDDVWMDGKVEAVLDAFHECNCPVVVHDCIVVDEEEQEIEGSFYDYRKSGPGKFKNYLKNSYVGCCMAFDSELVKHVLPIPDDIEMHDQWIGLIGEKLGKPAFITDRLILFKRHGDNSSDPFHHYPLKRMIHNRLVLLKELLKHKI